MKKVVFLDYDGVVNRKMWSNVDGKWVCRYGYPEDGMVNDVQAVQWVSEFCEKYEYDIVVTGTWRKHREWEQCLRNAGLRESVKILGTTPLPARSRVQEISDFLAAHSDIESYLIFDDDASLFEDESGEEYRTAFESLGVHGNNLVLCYSERGFGEEEYNMAIALHFRQKYRLPEELSSMSTDSRDSKILINAAIELLYVTGELTTAFLQRAFGIGYRRAIEIIRFLLENKILVMTNKKGQIKYFPLIECEEAKSKL